MDTTLHVITGVDAADEARRRQGDFAGKVFDTRTGEWIRDNDPREVKRGVLRVNPAAHRARVRDGLLRRRVQHGNAIGASSFRVADEGALNALELGVSRMPGRSNDGDVFQL